MLCVYLGLGDAGVSVQLTVISVGSAVTATHPVLSHIALLQRKRRVNTSRSRFMTALQGLEIGQTSFNVLPWEHTHNFWHISYKPMDKHRMYVFVDVFIVYV